MLAHFRGGLAIPYKEASFGIILAIRFLTTDKSKRRVCAERPLDNLTFYIK